MPKLRLKLGLVWLKMLSKTSFPRADSFPHPYALFLAIKFSSIFLEDASQPYRISSPLSPYAISCMSDCDVEEISGPQYRITDYVRSVSVMGF